VLHGTTIGTNAVLEYDGAVNEIPGPPQRAAGDPNRQVQILGPDHPALY
jgi:hypothetical protein